MRARTLAPVGLLLLVASPPLVEASVVLYDWRIDVPLGQPFRHIVRVRPPPDTTIYAEAACFQDALVQVQVITTAVGGVGSTSCAPGDSGSVLVPVSDGTALLVVTAEGIGLRPGLARVYAQAD